MAALVPTAKRSATVLATEPSIVLKVRWRYAPYLSRTTKEAALPGANPGVGRITAARDKRRITPLALCALPVPDDERRSPRAPATAIRR